MSQSTLEMIRNQHRKLLSKSAEMTKADVSQVEEFIKCIAKAGGYIKDPDQRSFLRALLRYWANFVNEKKGIFPSDELQPFNNFPPGEGGLPTTQQTTGATEPATKAAIEQATKTVAGQATKAAIEQATQMATEADGATGPTN